VSFASELSTFCPCLSLYVSPSSLPPSLPPFVPLQILRPGQVGREAGRGGEGEKEALPEVQESLLGCIEEGKLEGSDEGLREGGREGGREKRVGFEKVRGGRDGGREGGREGGLERTLDVASQKALGKLIAIKVSIGPASTTPPSLPPSLPPSCCCCWKSMARTQPW